MIIKKIIKIFIFVASATFLATNFCNAQEIIPTEPQGLNQNINPQQQITVPPNGNNIIENNTAPNNFGNSPFGNNASPSNFGIPPSENNATPNNFSLPPYGNNAAPSNLGISPLTGRPEIIQGSTTIGGTNGEKVDPSLRKFLKIYEPPTEVPKEKPAERPINANPCKPDICGNIIFDLTQGAQPINLQETLEIAMQKNFDIQIFAQRTERDRWRYYQTITNWLPDVTFNQLIQRNQGQFVIAGVLSDTVSETAFQSDIDYIFTASIRKYFDLQTAKNVYNSQRKKLEFTRNQTLRDSATRYYDLLRSKKRIEILQTNIEQIREQLRINREKLEAGIGTRFDVLRAEADLARANQDLTLAQNRYRFNQAQLANIIGISVFCQLVPDDNDIKIKEIFKDCFDLNKAKELAICTRPDLQAAKFDIEATRQYRNSAYSIYVPEVSIIGQVARQGTFQTQITPNRFTGVFVQWNAGTSLGLRGYTDIRSRNAELEESKLNYINTSRDIEENLVRTFFNTVTARSLIDSTWAEVQAASESRNISMVRLRAGIGTFIDVLQTQTTYTTARINHLDAVVGYDVSQIDLLFEMGVISVNNILEGFNSNNCGTTK